MKEGYHTAIVAGFATGIQDSTGIRRVQIRFELEEGPEKEYVSKTYFFDNRVDNGGKTQAERYGDDLATLLSCLKGVECSLQDVLLVGWHENPALAVGTKCSVKTRVRTVGDKTYHEVMYVNVPRQGMKGDNKWSEVAALLRKAKPAVPTYSGGTARERTIRELEAPAFEGFTPGEQLPF